MWCCKSASRNCHVRPRFGYRLIHVLLRREGIEANHKRIFRLYHDVGLAVRHRRKRRGVAVEREKRELPSRPNEVWSMDIVSDALDQWTYRNSV